MSLKIQDETNNFVGEMRSLVSATKAISLEFIDHRANIKRKTIKQNVKKQNEKSRMKN